MDISVSTDGGSSHAILPALLPGGDGENDHASSPLCLLAVTATEIGREGPPEFKRGDKAPATVICSGAVAVVVPVVVVVVVGPVGPGYTTKVPPSRAGAKVSVRLALSEPADHCVSPPVSAPAVTLTGQRKGRFQGNGEGIGTTDPELEVEWKLKTGGERCVVPATYAALPPAGVCNADHAVAFEWF